MILDNPNLSTREKLVLLHALGSMFMDAPHRSPPEPPKVDPEWVEGWNFAEAGGKLKANPYEGGSTQWWAFHNGYQAQKKVAARAFRAKQRRGEA